MQGQIRLLVPDILAISLIIVADCLRLISLADRGTIRAVREDLEMDRWTKIPLCVSVWKERNDILNKSL